MKKKLFLLMLLGIISCESNTLKKEIELYDNGVVKRVFYVDKIGNRQGKAVSYYEDGTLQDVMYFSNDLANGVFLSYDENGILRNKGKYLNDIQVDTTFFYTEKGKLESYVILNEKSEYLEDVFFYPNGKLKTVGTYFIGTKELNAIKYYDERGKLITHFPSKFVTINENNDGSLLFNLCGVQTTHIDSVAIIVLNDFDFNQDDAVSKILRKSTYLNGEDLSFSIINSDYIGSCMFLEIVAYGMLDGFIHSQSFHVQLQKGKQIPKDNLHPISRNCSESF